MKKSVLFFILLVFMACQNSNPLLTEQQTPFGVPAFDQIKVEHYMPAFEAAIQANQAEIDAIINNPAAPTFETSCADHSQFQAFVSLWKVQQTQVCGGRGPARGGAVPVPQARSAFAAPPPVLTRESFRNHDG